MQGNEHNKKCGIFVDLNARKGNESIDAIKQQYNEETINYNEGALVDFRAQNPPRIITTFFHTNYYTKTPCQTYKHPDQEETIYVLTGNETQEKSWNMWGYWHHLMKSEIENYWPTQQQSNNDKRYKLVTSNITQKVNVDDIRRISNKT